MKAAAPDLAIDLRHVSKTYKGRVRALRGIELRVGRGEIFGLLGPNGAGKSTLVKILMTVIKPSKCRGSMLYRPVGDKRVLSKVGYLPEHHRVPDYLTGAQVLGHYAALAGVPRRLRKKRIGMLLDLVDMRDWSRVKVKGYSKGMRQRVGLAQALMNNPDLVVLDEPTDGVDPIGRRDIRKILERIKSQGTTVFINSHILSELEMICDRVAILVQGVVSTQGSIDELTRHQQRYELELDVPQSMVDPATLVAEAIPGSLERLPAQPNTLEDTLIAQTRGVRPSHIGQLPTGEEMEVGPTLITIKTNDAERIQPVLDALREAGVVITSVRPMRPSLEDLFMQAIRDPETGEILHTGAERRRRRKP